MPQTTPRRLILLSTNCSDSKPEVMMTEMFHPEVEEAAIEEAEVVADKMPSMPLELPMTISQLCEHEDHLDLQSKVLPDSSMFDQWSLKTTERFGLSEC
jgi:hypothetical protein